MSDGTKIEWTDASWNPLRGCSRVSEGCRNCYAETVAGRFSGPGMPYEGLITKTAKGSTWNGEIKLVPEKLAEPLRWQKPRMIFVNSMSDLFHGNVPDEYIDQVFAVMALALQHTFQVLTKRPERMLAYLEAPDRDEAIGWAAAQIVEDSGRGDYGIANGLIHGIDGYISTVSPKPHYYRWPLPNVWLGVSVENQATADERIPLLLHTPAAVRWVSAEPLLGPVSFRWAKWHDWNKLGAHHHLDGIKGIDWVVAGGESGPNARPMHPQWARSLRDQCQEAGVAFHFKQWGEWRPISQGQDDWYDDLYKPNRIAKGNEDQDALNDSYGRTCTVPNGIVHFDGSLHGITDMMAFQAGTGAMHSFKVGKKTAGRLLDGRTWDEYPA